MIVLIKSGGQPMNVSGPPLPFTWLSNLEVPAIKEGSNFIVQTLEIVKKLRLKDQPHGNRFADFFANFKTEKMIFDANAVNEITAAEE